MTMTVEIKNADQPNSLNGLKLTGGHRDGMVLKPQESTEVSIHSGTDSNVIGKRGKVEAIDVREAA